MARPAILSLFSGVGGLDLGIQLALPGARVLGYVERDAYAASVLMARMEDASMESAPVFIGDICNLDGGELRNRVDIICGGFPCQDISVAGKGEGIGGKRSGLWSEIVRLADEIRPRYLFLENVSAIITRGLSTVLADLASLGFDAEWLCLRASDMGAPHRRERWFCLAYRKGAGLQGISHRRDSLFGSRQESGALADAAGGRSRGAGCSQEPNGKPRCTRTSGDLLGNTQHVERWPVDECGGCGGEGCDCQGQTAGGAGVADETLAHPNINGPEIQRRGELLDGERAAQRDNADGCLSIFPPGPADHDEWRAVLEHSPHLAPAVESGVRVLVDGESLVVDSCRADQFRCSGNGVVALQAAVAFTVLARRAGLMEVANAV